METPLVEDGVVISNAQLDCRLLEGEIVVAHIKREHVLQAAWVVLKVALFADDEAEAARRQLQRLNDPTAHAVEDGPAIAPMRALVLDGDGATLVMGRRHWGLVRESGLDRLVEVAPHAWRAFEFNLGHMVAEVPGVVNHLAKLMADDNISVLHHSTYGSEIFLVQQRELSKAISCIRKKVDATLSFLLEQRSASVPASTDSEGTPPPPESPLKATSTATSGNGSSNAPSPAAGPASSGATTTETQQGLRERLRVRQWQQKPAPHETPLHHGHSHRGYEGEGDGDVEPGSPSPAHHHSQRRLLPHLQPPPPPPPPSHHVHVHSSAHHLWPGSSGDTAPPPPLSSSPFSLHGCSCPPPQLVLRVMPKRLVLARIHKECLLECAGVLTRLFLFDQAPAQHFSSSSSHAHAHHGSSSGCTPLVPPSARKQHYYQRERSLSLSRGEMEQQQGSSPAASAHASSVPRLIPRNTTCHNTPSSSTLASSVSPSIVGISPAESLGISPALGGASHPSHQQQQQAPYRGDTDFGPLALIEMEGQEVTLLLPEEDLPLFPMGALVACPLRWTPIKLCGRRFGFHETGVVSAMSKVDAGVPILNVSTFLTNVTLVRIVDLPATLDTLSEELDASIDGLHTLGPLEEGGGEEEEEEEDGGREELVARMAGLGSVGGHGRV